MPSTAKRESSNLLLSSRRSKRVVPKVAEHIASLVPQNEDAPFRSEIHSALYIYSPYYRTLSESCPDRTPYTMVECFDSLVAWWQSLRPLLPTLTTTVIGDPTQISGEACKAFIAALTAPDKSSRLTPSNTGIRQILSNLAMWTEAGYISSIHSKSTRAIPACLAILRDPSIVTPQLQALAEQFGPCSYSRKTKQLSFVTQPVTIRHTFTLSGNRQFPVELPFGTFRVTIRLGALINALVTEGGAPPGCVTTFTALNPHPSSSGATHPHLSGSTLCYGHGAAMGSKLLSEGRFLEFADLVQAILNTYGSSPHYHLEQWVDIFLRCRCCGTINEKTPDFPALPRCGVCNSDFCPTCVPTPSSACSIKNKDGTPCTRTKCTRCTRDKIGHHCRTCKAALCRDHVTISSYDGNPYCPAHYDEHVAAVSKKKR